MTAEYVQLGSWSESITPPTSPPLIPEMSNIQGPKPAATLSTSEGVKLNPNSRGKAVLFFLLAVAAAFLFILIKQELDKPRIGDKNPQESV
jgi:capsular polysaccharide biosynthesis protein